MSQVDQIKSYLRLVSLCGASEALRAALETGVIDALQGPPQTLPELAEACRMQEQRLQMVLDVLIHLGAVERYGDDYALSTAMRLASQHPDTLHGGHWQSLNSFLQTPPEEEAEPDDEALHAFRGQSLSTQWTMTAAAMELAELLDIGERRRGSHILDLGAGAAMWSCAMAYRDPESRVTAVEMAEALSGAQRTADEIGIADRVELMAGDYRSVELPEQTYDLALAVNLLELAPLEEAEPWLRRIHAALRPDGELIVVTRMPGQSMGDLHRTLAALELALRVPAAQSHGAEAIWETLKRAGFDAQPPQMLDAPPYSMGVLIGRRE